MKKIILLVTLSFCINNIHAQILKKLKDKVNNAVDKTIGTDSTKTDIEKKEDAASDQYSDVTENNEKPIFVDAAPANGKMVLKFKKGDVFWGGNITITGQPKNGDNNANVLDFINARVGSLYNAGEISGYAIYFDGQRLLNDLNIIPLRTEFISFDINKTPLFSSTEAKVDVTVMPPMVTQGTFSFNYNGKTYGPFNGIGEKMLVFKSMTDGKPTEKFYGFGLESYIGEKQAGFNALIQTEKTVVRIKDGYETAPTYPGGFMAMAKGNTVNTFSNGKTVPVMNVAGIEKNMYDAVPKGGKYYSDIYGTDSGHVVCIVTEIDKTNNMAKPSVEAIIDYKTTLKYPVEITRKNLLVARNPAKSVLYKMHTIYYPDGTKETIDNVGDAQLVSFNNKEYIVWFEMKKAADGHEIYVCQKELK